MLHKKEFESSKKLCDWVNKHKVKVVSIAHCGVFAANDDYVLFFEGR